jgi:adenylate cyclase
MSNIALNRFSIRRGLREDDVAMADQYLLEALSRNKREGLLLADMDAWNDERTAAGEETIMVSVGTHHGNVVLGDIGSERRLEYAVLGDAVNVASRLEELTRSLGVRMAVSDDLAKAIGDEAGGNEADGETGDALAGFTNAGPRVVRGRDEPIAVWTI